MIEFFRDVLDGPLYFIVVILSIIFIMAIIGFIMERKKFEQYEKNKVAFVSNDAPIEEEKKEEPNLEEAASPIDNENIPVINQEIPVINQEINNEQNSNIN